MMREIFQDVMRRIATSHYILAGREVLQVTLVEYIRWLEDHVEEKFLCFDPIKRNVEVSTVFLGLDHSLGRMEKPILFETMIFGGKRHGFARRYTDFDDAIQGHQQVVRELMKIERVPRRWRARIEGRMFRREFNRLTDELKWIPTELELAEEGN